MLETLFEDELVFHIDSNALNKYKSLYFYIAFEITRRSLDFTLNDLD